MYKERLLTSRNELPEHSTVNPEMAEKYRVKIMKLVKLTLESELKIIKKARRNRFAWNERVPFSLEHHIKLCFLLVFTIGEAVQFHCKTLVETT
jgi:hypothetical protein